MQSKSIFTYIGEAIDRYQAERQQPVNGNIANTNSTKRLPAILHWFLPNGGTILIVLLLLLTQQVWANNVQTNSINTPGVSATTINYQGRLAAPDGTPQNGTFGMSFTIWDAAAGGNIIWGPENHTAVPVTEGLFNVGLGSQTSGGIPTTAWNGDRYLEIMVAGETLSPRELIRSVPIAGMALTVPDGAITSRHLKPILNKVIIGPNAVSLTNEIQTLVSTSIHVDVPSSVWVFATCDCVAQNGAFIAARVIANGVVPPPGSGQGMFLGPWPSSPMDIRSSISNSYVFDLDPGTHLIEFQARNLNSTGNATAHNHTGFSYMVVSRD